MLTKQGMIALGKRKLQGLHDRFNNPKDKFRNELLVFKAQIERWEKWGNTDYATQLKEALDAYEAEPSPDKMDTALYIYRYLTAKADNDVQGPAGTQEGVGAGSQEV